MSTRPGQMLSAKGPSWEDKKDRRGLRNLGGLRVPSRAARRQAEVELGGAVRGAGCAAAVLRQHQKGVVDRRVAQHAGRGEGAGHVVDEPRAWR